MYFSLEMVLQVPLFAGASKVTSVSYLWVQFGQLLLHLHVWFSLASTWYLTALQKYMQFTLLDTMLLFRYFWEIRLQQCYLCTYLLLLGSPSGNELEDCCSELTWTIKTGADAILLTSILALTHPLSENQPSFCKLLARKTNKQKNPLRQSTVSSLFLVIKEHQPSKEAVFNFSLVVHIISMLKRIFYLIPYIASK